ncbi:hypothetical protein lerEdw1_013098 [Lerista edwardsae]|nr:hypothetical protein lerEdw1_013098 [Lerista edwardsae]
MAGEKRNRRNCTKGAFSVISTTGSMKLRRRSSTLCYKLSDSGSRYWEDLSTPDCSVNALIDESNPGTSFSAIDTTEPAEDREPFQTAAGWVFPSTESHDDIDMEPATDLQRKRDGFHTGLMINMPQRASSSSELPKGLGVFEEELGMVLDHSLLMDIDPSDSMRVLHGPVACPLSRPLLPEPLGDIIMQDEARIRKSKELSLLERVGETLRQKKLRATQA